MIPKHSLRDLQRNQYKLQIICRENVQNTRHSRLSRVRQIKNTPWNESGQKPRSESNEIWAIADNSR